MFGLPSKYAPFKRIENTKSNQKWYIRYYHGRLNLNRSIRRKNDENDNAERR